MENERINHLDDDKKLKLVKKACDGGNKLG